MKLSIITINFNNHEGLQKTIDSVICQTFTDYGWIVIDGGSTDGSCALIEQYQDFFSYWCSEPDKGIYNAMNKGIQHAEGDYLLFLNSGDCLYDAETLTKAFANTISADILSGQVVRMDNGRLLRTYDEDIFMQLFKDTLNHQGTFIRKKLFDEFKYDESLKIVSDWKFWIEAIVLGKASVVYIDTIVAIQDMSGITSVSSAKQSLERDNVLKGLFPPLLLQEIKRYCLLKENDYYNKSEYLRANNIYAYRIGLRFISLLARIVNLFK